MAASRGRLLAYLAFATIALVAIIREVSTLYRAYVPEPGWFDPLLVLGAAGLGVFRTGRGLGAVQGNAIAAALCALCLPWACWLTFTLPAAVWAGRAAGIVLAYAGAHALATLTRTAGRPALQLGFVPYLLNPVRLVLGLALGIGFLVVDTRAGLLRAGALTAALLSLIAVWAHAGLSAALAPPPPPLPWYRVTAHLMLIAAATVLLLTERIVPFAEVASYPNLIVYAEDGDHERYVVTAGSRGRELYADGRVTASPIDGHRYYEALVHPAASHHRGAARVLLLNGGWGQAERLINESLPSAELTVVVPDSARMPLARRLPWLHQRGIGPGVFEAAVDEPILWLGRNHSRFDVIIADLAAPSDFIAGKYYTTYFVRLLADHLENDGIAVLPAASATDSPTTHGNIVATIRDAGLYVISYHAPVSTSGLQSFVLAAKRPTRPVLQPARGPARFTNGIGMRLLFEQTPDTMTRVAPPCSLSDQHAVEAFTRERLGMRDMEIDG